MTYIPIEEPLEVIDHLSQEAKDGTLYFTTNIVSVVASSSHWVAIETDGSAELSFLMALDSEGRAILRGYEGGGYATTGTELSLFNAKRGGTSAPQTNVFSSVTVSTTGTPFIVKLLTGGEKKRVTGAETAVPVLELKEDSTYLFRITNDSGSTQAIAYTISFHD